MPRQILIPTKLQTVAADLLREHGYHVVQDDQTPLAELLAAHPDTQALIVRSETIGAEVFDALPRLQLIVRAGAGYDNIDVKEARRRNIDVMNTPGANANAVAEEVITLILAAYRHVVRADQTTRDGEWQKKALMGRELTGKTVGIVGLGNIGQLVVKRLSGFDCRFLAYDPVLSSKRAEDLGVTQVELPELFAQADIVTLHVPETNETRKMVNRDLLSRMKTGAVLVNCARAGVIDEDDLRALKDEKQLVFCNDVYPKDEAGKKPIADIADLLMPHLGANTVEANTNAARRAAQQILNYFQSGVTKYVVNRAAPEGLDEAYLKLAFQLTKVARQYLGARPLRRIEVSLYGELDAFQPFFLPPIVLGLSQDFDPTFDLRDADGYLEGKGIALEWRTVDNRKGYGETITIDLMEGQGSRFHRVSVRGTVAEGRSMVSRIAKFDGLYFDPSGHNVFVVYHDRPGMLAKITGVFARHGINIDDIRAPNDPTTGDSMAVLKVNQPATKELLEEIRQTSGARQAVACSLN